MFSASIWQRKVLDSWPVAHAMLHYLLPGSDWPARSTKETILTTVPVELSHVHVNSVYRRQGYGNCLVKQCLAYATRRHWPVVLRVKQYGGGDTMNPEQLRAWYERLGFVTHTIHHGITYMVKRVN